MDLSTAAYAYEPDTEVVDEPAPPIAIGRTSTEDLTMQVLIADRWHRKMADADETACEVTFRLVETSTRREQLTHADRGELCSACFTPREMRRATENDRRNAEDTERRLRREHIDSRFKALPRMQRTEGER
jgi:hypothetical protein